MPPLGGRWLHHISARSLRCPLCKAECLPWRNWRTIGGKCWWSRLLAVFLLAYFVQRDWSRVDPSIYAQCFTGWAKSPSWCVICVTLDHDTADSPYASNQERRARRPSPYAAAGGPSHKPSLKGQAPVCIKFNKYNGDCRHGESCKFRHVCSQCQGAHPRSQCKQERSQTSKDV
jgi:hypothetical protein